MVITEVKHPALTKRHRGTPVWVKRYVLFAIKIIFKKEKEDICTYINGEKHGRTGSVQGRKS